MQRSMAMLMAILMTIAAAYPASFSDSPITEFGQIIPGLEINTPEKEPENAKYIALTFDDGPHKSRTARLLDILGEYGARATFFVLGENADKNRDILERMVAEGHAIGNHTYEHERLTKQSNSERKKAVGDTQDAIIAAGYTQTKLLRPPYGSIDDDVRAWARDNDYTIIWWSYSVSDYKLKDKDKISDKVMGESQSGDIILLHDIHEFTVDAVEIIVREMQKDGWVFLTVPELIEKLGKELGDQLVWKNAR